MKELREKSTKDARIEPEYSASVARAINEILERFKRVQFKGAAVHVFPTDADDDDVLALQELLTRNCADFDPKLRKKEERKKMPAFETCLLANSGTQVRANAARTLCTAKA